jgi:hypothetical protein
VHVEKLRPLRPHHWRARNSDQRPSVYPEKSVYLLTWPRPDGVAYAAPSEFLYLGTGRLIICDLTRPGSAQLAQLVNTFLDLLPISPKRRQIFSKSPALSARSTC